MSGAAAVLFTDEKMGMMGNLANSSFAECQSWMVSLEYGKRKGIQPFKCSVAFRSIETGRVKGAFRLLSGRLL